VVEAVEEAEARPAPSHATVAVVAAQDLDVTRRCGRLTSG
jgi:hypothetical protein